jgi:tetratricopeptide (TPR) repeat protein
MIPSLLLAAAFLLPSASSAQDAAGPKPAAAGMATAPDPSLVRLDGRLRRAQADKAAGRSDEKSYKAFVVRFRADLDGAMSRARPTPVNQALYARILSRLGDSRAALSTLSSALKASPKNPGLHVAAADVSYRRKDYPAALAEAKAALKLDPGNKEALTLEHFSEGRVAPGDGAKGAAVAGAPPAEPVAAATGSRVERRLGALRWTKQAMTRLNENDPDEALRFLSLAQASDPTLPDVPMQQGLAYMELKRPKEALPRFVQAERMWQANGDAKADLAHKLAEAARKQAEAASRSVEAPPRPVNDPRRKDWPLGGAAAGLLLAGEGASFMKREDDDGAWRKPVLIGGMVVLGVAGGGLLGFAAYAMAAPAVAGAGGLALASGGVMATADAAAGAAVTTAAGAAAGGAYGAKTGKHMADALPEKSPPPATPALGGGPGEGPGPIPAPAPIPGPVDSPTGEDCALRSGEDVVGRFVDGTRLAPGFLQIHEKEGGHAIREHVGKSDEYLLKRLSNERAASSFYDMSVAEATIREAVNTNLSNISGWMNTTSSKMVVNYVGASPVGTGVSLADRVPRQKSNTRVVLIKRQACRILILTAFPY